MKYILIFSLITSFVNCVYFYQCHFRGQTSVSSTQALFKRCRPKHPRIWHWSQSISAIGTLSPQGYSIDCMKRGCRYFGNRLRRRECSKFDTQKDKCDRWEAKWINIH